jgi:hypothetical protein
MAEQTVNDVELMANSHLITYKYFGPTNTRDARIKIKSEFWAGFSDSTTAQHTKWIKYGPDNRDTLQIVAAWLINKGYTILAKGAGKEWDWVMVKEFYAFEHADNNQV